MRVSSCGVTCRSHSRTIESEDYSNSNRNRHYSEVEYFLLVLLPPLYLRIISFQTRVWDGLGTPGGLFLLSLLFYGGDTFLFFPFPVKRTSCCGLEGKKEKQVDGSRAHSVHGGAGLKNLFFLLLYLVKKEDIYNKKKKRPSSVGVRGHFSQKPWGKRVFLFLQTGHKVVRKGKKDGAAFLVNRHQPRIFSYFRWRKKEKMK